MGIQELYTGGKEGERSPEVLGSPDIRGPGRWLVSSMLASCGWSIRLVHLVWSIWVGPSGLVRPGWSVWVSPSGFTPPQAGGPI